MEKKSYKIITQNAEAEIEEKKSRFIGQVFYVETQEQAQQIIAETGKKYWDARHNCYAYVIGEGSEVTRCSDNGEPSGTAGKPILEVLTGAGLTNVLLIVTRYFGGTLLGTGGLVRAYTQASQAALSASQTALMTYGQKFTIHIAYNMTDRLMHRFGQMGIELQNPQYAADVTYDIYLSDNEVSEIKDIITDLTDGRAVIDEGEKGFYPIPERKPV